MALVFLALSDSLVVKSLTNLPVKERHTERVLVQFALKQNQENLLAVCLDELHMLNIVFMMRIRNKIY